MPARYLSAEEKQSEAYRLLMWLLKPGFGRLPGRFSPWPAAECESRQEAAHVEVQRLIQRPWTITTVQRIIQLGRQVHWQHKAATSRLHDKAPTLTGVDRYSLETHALLLQSNYELAKQYWISWALDAMDSSPAKSKPMEPTIPQTFPPGVIDYGKWQREHPKHPAATSVWPAGRPDKPRVIALADRMPPTT